MADVADRYTSSERGAHKPGEQSEPSISTQNYFDYSSVFFHGQERPIYGSRGLSDLSQYGLGGLEIYDPLCTKAGAELADAITKKAESSPSPEVKGDSLVANVYFNLIDGKDVARERNDVVARLEKQIPDAQEVLRMKIYLGNFEERMEGMEKNFMKQGLSEAQAHEKVREQIRDVYKEVNRLLDTTTESSTGVDAKERLTLAKQILHNSMDPTYINQGFHNTCNVAALEARTYTVAPAQAAHLVADAALTGKYVTRDGAIISIDKGSLQPHDEAKSDPPSDGGRNYASQIFQVTAVNIHYQRLEPQWTYEQRERKPGEGDTGERRVDHSVNPPKDDVTWFEKYVGGESSGKYRTPLLDGADVMDIGNQIMDNNNYEWLLCHESRTYDKVPKVHSYEDFEARLQAAYNDGRLPLVIAVHTGNEPFKTESDGGKEGGSGGWHVVTVTNYRPGPPARVQVDNQWDPRDDHARMGESIDAKLLYRAMMPPE